MRRDHHSDLADDLPAVLPDAPADMVAGTGFTSRPPRLGLAEPLALRGGDAHALVRSAVELGFEWQVELRAAVDLAFSPTAGEASWFRMDPVLLLGEPGVGRTHVARRVAHVAGVPHVLVDLTEPGGEDQLWPQACGPDLILPSLPVLAMAVGGCANPVVSVLGIERLDARRQQRFAAMLHPDTAGRLIDYATGAMVDLRQVSWMVQGRDAAALSPAIGHLLRPLELVWPGAHHLPLHHAEILAEAAIDMGVIDRVQDRAAEGLRVVAGVHPSTTAEIYGRARRWLAAEFA